MAETHESAGGCNFLVKTPAKLIITGEHAVVYGQLALAASVDLLTEIHVTLHNQENKNISIHFENLKFHWTLPLDKFPPVSLVAAELIDQLQSIVPTDLDPIVRMSLSALCFLYLSIVRPEPPYQGFEMRIQSSIPIGAGLGSSAAFSVGLSAAFHRIAASVYSKFVPDLESINGWALQCEKMFHATPSGIDNAVCTYGGFVKFQNRKVAGFMDVPEARILLVDTQISRQTKLQVEGVRQKHGRLPAVIDPILEAIGNISHQMVEVMQQPPETNYPIIRVTKTNNLTSILFKFTNALVSVYLGIGFNKSLVVGFVGRLGRGARCYSQCSSLSRPSW